MSSNTKQMVNLFEILPETDQNMILELTKRLIKAYDPDYTKLLPDEKEALMEVISDYKNGINIDDGTEIEW